MKRITQTIVDRKFGNCMQAAIASLFSLDLDQVPNFVKFSVDDWGNVFNGFVWGLGYEYEGHYTLPDKPSDPKFDDCHVEGLFYASVPSRNLDGVTHAVLINREGIVVHDPAPPNRASWKGENIVEQGNIKFFYGIKKRR